MSNPGEDFCRRDRLSYRPSHPITGAASAPSDRYHLPSSSYDSTNFRQHLHHESIVDSKRRHPSPTPHPASVSYEGNESSANDRRLPTYDDTNYYLHSSYDLNNHRLPPLPPSPNHFVLDSEETFIPPPDCYLSPPAPAPPDKFQQPSLSSHDRFLLPAGGGNVYLTSTTSAIDKYNSSNSEPVYDRYWASEKYGNPSSPDTILERYSDRFNTSSSSSSTSYSGGPGDPYVQRDVGYHNHYRLLNTAAHYHQQKSALPSQQRFLPSSVRSVSHNQYPSLRTQKCCNTYGSGRETSQSRDVSPGGQTTRIRSARTSSPVSLLLSSTVAATIPVDFSANSTTSGEKFQSSYSSSTLPRCNSYGDMQSNPSNIGTFRRSPATGHENCCYKRRTSSPSSSSSLSFSIHPASYSSSTTTASTSSSVSSLASQNYHQTSMNNVWKSAAVASNTSTSAVLQNNLSSTTPITSAHQQSSAVTTNNGGSNVNSPSLSFSSSSRSSPSLTTMSTKNTTASATTSPTAISTNSGSSGALTDHPTHSVQRSISGPATVEFDEETTSPSTEMAEDSLSSTNESLTSPSSHHMHSQMVPPPPPPSLHRNAPVSLPVVHTGNDRPSMSKTTLQHQISAPVTANEIASSRRYSRSISKKEAIKNYIKKETAVFFGVHEPTEENERARWLDRRKRLAYRTYGKLKNEYQFPSACSTLQKPDVLPLTSQRHSRATETIDERDAGEPRSIESTLKRKPSVARMTIDGMAYMVSTLGRHKRRPSSTSRQWSRSYAPSSVPPTPCSPLDDEVFFDKSSSSGDDSRVKSSGAAAAYDDISYEPSTMSGIDQLDSEGNAQHRQFGSATYKMQKESRHSTWRRTNRRQEEPEEPQIGLSRIWGRFLDRVLDNSDRRQYGMGVVGRVFGRSLKRSVVNREPVKEQLEDLEDHRPFFTYWVTTVQILILVLSMFAYGMGPIGFELTQRSGLVLVTSLSLQQVEYSEPSNFWIGPRAADLIHMGAKFAPCMRKDKKIIKEIEKMRDRERETACCIRNDDSGCVQASQAECSYLIPSRNRLIARNTWPTKTISTWKKWSPGESGPGGRISGSVCGLDPKFCEAPASIAPYEWPDDITKWPICRKMNSRFPVQMSPSDNHRYQKDKMTAEHMVCEVIGHPCCIGIHGTCRITTKEYCDFVHGYFHEEASLCSQVSCLDDVCGMIPFYFPEVPDQFYRLWTSLFIHAGVIHLAISVIIQYFFMRDLEKLTGSVRIGFIYIGSGVAGNLASAIFVPYRADVGPAGSQFGLLACLIVEVLNCWPMLKHPFQALMKLLAITLALFVFGLLPWVDNFAHLFGFIFGFLLSYAVLPFVSFGPYDRQKKIFLIWVCLLSSLFLFTLLILLFYLIPIYDCEVCHYFNCIPLTRDFCATQNINFKREEYIV